MKDRAVLECQCRACHRRCLLAVEPPEPVGDPLNPNETLARRKRPRDQRAAAGSERTAVAGSPSSASRPAAQSVPLVTSPRNSGVSTVWL
ncbi:MAG: hypothetical protein ACK55Z_32195, partial [bacterium]